MLFPLVLFIPLIIALIQVGMYAAGKFKDGIQSGWVLVEVISMIIYPLLYLYTIGGLDDKNDCCNFESTPILSPDHRLSILTLIALIDIAFFFSMHRKNILSPLLEVMVNCLLLCGIPLVIALAVQHSDSIMLLAANFIIIILYLLVAVHKNHKLFMHSIEHQSFADSNPLLRIFQ